MTVLDKHRSDSIAYVMYEKPLGPLGQAYICFAFQSFALDDILALTVTSALQSLKFTAYQFVGYYGCHGTMRALTVASSSMLTFRS